MDPRCPMIPAEHTFERQEQPVTGLPRHRSTWILQGLPLTVPIQVPAARFHTRYFHSSRKRCIPRDGVFNGPLSG